MGTVSRTEFTGPGKIKRPTMPGQEPLEFHRERAPPPPQTTLVYGFQNESKGCYEGLGHTFGLNTCSKCHEQEAYQQFPTAHPPDLHLTALCSAFIKLFIWSPKETLEYISSLGLKYSPLNNAASLSLS